MSWSHDDERDRSRRDHRQAAVYAQDIAAGLVEQSEADGTPPDWELVRYWQRDALIEATLALSAGDA